MLILLCAHFRESNLCQDACPGKLVSHENYYVYCHITLTYRANISGLSIEVTACFTKVHVSNNITWDLNWVAVMMNWMLNKITIILKFHCTCTCVNAKSTSTDCTVCKCDGECIKGRVIYMYFVSRLVCMFHQSLIILCTYTCTCDVFVQVVRLLLSYGADCNIKNSFGETALGVCSIDMRKLILSTCKYM